MATKFITHESAFRMCSARYLQEEGAAGCVADELALLGCSAPLIIAGKTAWHLAGAAVEGALQAAGMAYVLREYSDFCCETVCDRIRAEVGAQFAFDSIVGIGGGNVMDAAKILAADAGLPLVNIPTSAATCAAVTPLSVRYNEAGHAVGSRHHRRAVESVLVDMDILYAQPVRLLVSGAFDALAKLAETKQRLIGRTEQEIHLGVQTGYVLSEYLYTQLLARLPQAVADLNAGVRSKAIYDVVYLNIAVTGIVSGLARGSNQSALAHKIYEKTRTLFPVEARPYLHGELVAVGLLAQLIYNGEAETERNFAQKMREYGMPCSLGDIGIPVGERTRARYAEELLATPLMEGTTHEEHEILRHALTYIL